MATDVEDRVCVVGAGISGLVTAKVCLAEGFDVDIFEKTSGVGGTWHSSRTYPDLQTNDPREMYRFADHPYPETTDEFPTAEQVRAYLESYADRFGLRDDLSCKTEVVSIRRASERSGGRHANFRVELQAADSSRQPETRHYEYVIICNGVFSQPHIPAFDGLERFDGEVLHSSELTETDSIADKRVVIIGGGKSAYDCASVAADYAASSTLVFRSARWLVPRYFFGLREDWVLLHRLGQAFLPYHTKRGIAALLHEWGEPLVDLFWRSQSWMVHRAVDIPPEMTPDRSLPMGLEGVGVGTEVYRKVRAGEVEPKRAEISAFLDSHTLRLDTGETLKADVVVCATGWNQSLDFLGPELQPLVRDDGFFTLYRHILPPRERHLGFVGYASSIGTTLTSEAAANWLAAFLRGRIDVPDVETMEAQIEKVRAWAEKMLPGPSGGYFIGPYIVDYVDQLLIDMEIDPHQADNPIEEYVGRFHPERFREAWYGSAR